MKHVINEPHSAERQGRPKADYSTVINQVSAVAWKLLRTQGGLTINLNKIHNNLDLIGYFMCKQASIKKLLGVTTVLLFIAFSTHAAEGEIVDLAMHKTLAEAIGVGVFKHRHMKAHDFTKYSHSSVEFSSTEKFAIQDELLDYSTHIIGLEEGAKVYFTRSTYSYSEPKCNFWGNPEAPSIIRVNNQLININYSCFDISGGGKLISYTPSSVEAQRFIYDAFAKETVVKVEFGQHTIDFLAKGFLNVWDREKNNPPAFERPL